MGGGGGGREGVKSKKDKVSSLVRIPINLKGSRHWRE